MYPNGCGRPILYGRQIGIGVFLFKATAPVRVQAGVAPTSHTRPVVSFLAAAPPVSCSGFIFLIFLRFSRFENFNYLDIIDL